MWYEFIINALIDLTVGVIVAYIISVFIDNKIKNRYKDRAKILEYYLFFESLKDKKLGELYNLDIKMKEIECFLSLKRFRKTKLYMLFEIVYRDIAEILRFKNTNQIIISKDNSDLQEFLLNLKIYID